MMHGKNVDTPNGKVYYWCSDSWSDNRKTLFFLHGMTADHNMFQSQYDYFAHDYNILSWDAPLHGKSRPFRAFSYEIAADCIKRIFETESIRKAVFIGQSMGGFLTQAVIKRYPYLVSGFVSIDSCPYGLQYYSKSDIWWLKQIEWMSELFPLAVLKKAIAKQCTLTKAGYNNMISMLEPFRKNELCHLMGLGYAGFIKDNCNLEIKCPVILIVGDKDRTGKVIKYNEQWKKNTGFQLAVIKGAAHNSNVDQPHQVNQVIDAFIRSQI
jgi:pimeloyl-ACP methyl ester carboxylesterase